MAELSGQTFAGYEILAKLGEGGFGAVYKARQPNLNRLVALKILAPHLAADADFVARFKREATLAASLNHPNLVLVFAAGQSDGSHYMAMEFVEGETLRNRIESHGRLDPREATAIAVYVAQALQYAWNKSRLIHRDIKPDNVFVSKTGEVKVGDLGLAKNVGQSTAGMTATGMMMGSPHYISPEQASAKKDIDFRADIYSLGCTLYHMLTGRLPYEGDEPMAVMNLHVNAPPPAIFKVWPTCPMPLALLVGKMLKKNPRERHASYEELIAELTAVHEKLTAAQTAAAAPPSGTITFLFTDIEGSTQLWEKHPQAMPIALERHNQLLRRTMESHGGFVFKTVGDAFCVAFASAPNAMAAALAGQRALVAEPWGATGPLRVRMALHTGAAEERGGDYFGPTVNRVARVLAAGHGGQILLSNATEQLVRDHLAEGVSLGDLGERSLKNLTRTERIFQVNLADMPTQFPTLRAAASPSTTHRRRQRMMLYGGAGAGVLVLLIGLLLWSPWSKPSSQDSNTPSLQHSAARPVDEAFIAEVARCSPENQVRQVMEKLKQLNPGFDGQETHAVENGQVVELSISDSSIVDISPLRALKRLRSLTCSGRTVSGQRARLSDLSPLRGMSLERLQCSNTEVGNYTPLEGMPLKKLDCYATRLKDLSPLRLVPLSDLNCSANPELTDLSPLEGKRMERLDFSSTSVSDLSPLSKMQVKYLTCFKTKAADLSSLRNAGLMSVRCDFDPKRDAAILRSIKTLKNINGLPVAEFWKKVKAGSVPLGCPGKERADATAHQAAAAEEPVAASASFDEHWQDWMAEQRQSGKIPNNFKDDGGIWVRTKPGATTGLACFLRDGAARTSFTLPDQTHTYAGLTLRRAENRGAYQALVSRTSVGFNRLEAKNPGQSEDSPPNNRELSRWPLPANVDPNQEMTLEFRAVGDEFSIKVNGQLVGTFRDSTYNREGEVALLYKYNETGARVSRIEVLNLDGASAATSAPAAAAALKQLGNVFTNSIGAEMVYIPPGEFLLGSTKEEQAWAMTKGMYEEFVKPEGEAPRKTRIKEGFWMGRTEVTVGQWKEFVTATGYQTDAERLGYVDTQTLGRAKGLSWRDPGFGEPPQANHPVCCVSWNDAVAFCEWLTERERKAGRLAAGHVVRLPTEAEWEYACRAGTQTKFWWGESEKDNKGRLNGAGKGDGFEFVAPVDSYGERGRNKLGLADMLGNVYEWCLDEYDDKQAHEECYKGNPLQRVLRGGGCCFGFAFTRSAHRSRGGPYSPRNDNGFRVAVGADVTGGETSTPTTPSATAPKEDGILAPVETRANALTANPKVGEVFTLDVDKGVTMDLMGIPPGEFMLGSTKEEQAWAVANGGKAEYIKREGETPRKAAIKQGFWMGRTEVTVGQWKQFVAVTGHASEAEKKGNACCYDRVAKTFTDMEGKSWRDPNFGAAPEDNHPVCCVSWNDAVVFCEWLTERERKAGRLPSGMVVRLPTEAEWEYACRAGTQTKFWWGESKEEGEGRLNWNGTADGFPFTSPADHYGARGRNGFGLADMAGNVQEWCLDNYDATGAHEECWKAGASRVLRGGSFHGLMPALARCACRNSFGPGVSNSSYGFRVVVASPR
ncbi:MAG: SUMF1/EgtB/PvdO family nonheme iron enzyme [Verrucomicrobiia bacterium]